MNKIYLLFVCCLMSFAASATVTTYPISVSAPYGGIAPSNICQNSLNTATTVTYSVCGTPGAVGALSVTATWYLNGVPVYTDGTIHVIAAGGGTIALLANKFPYSTFGSFTGANGLYCQLSWTGPASPAACGSTNFINGAPTDVTVNEAPTAIMGATSVCTGDTTTLSDAVTGSSSVWSTSSSTIASVAFSTGLVTGNAAGVVRITYTLGSGCFTTQLFTVNQTPAAITGTVSVCEGTLTTLHSTTTGGIWTSMYDTVATIGAGTGGLQAIDTGVTAISYTLGTGCMTVTSVTVNQQPSVITGPNTVCSASTINLTDSVAGGVWTSSSPAIASVNFSTGVVTGVAATGVAHISYELNSGCTATYTITVNPLPAVISGNASVCVGSLTSLSDVTAGGNWSTSNASAVVGSGSGFVITGAVAGLDTVYYTLPTGCFRSKIVTVNALPAAISGANVVCAGSVTALTDSPTGGTWTSSVTTVATIATSGIVTGVASGVTTITYKLSTGCLITAPLTVNALPAVIAGANTVCVGAIITLSDGVSGGVWSSSNTSVALIGTGTGIVGGNGVGTSIISYTFTSTGCARSFILTVNAVPAVITGAPAVCIGSSTALSDVTIGGTWSSSNTGIATVSAAGLVTGISTGVATISYKIATGCFVTATMSVNPLPSAITGIPRVCVGSVTALSDPTGGGTWSSSNTAIGSVDASGNVSGLSAGTVSIIYTGTTSCKIATTVTVNQLPSAILGVNNVCVGLTATLSDTPVGGAWSATNGNATVSAAGLITGMISGVDTINYTLTTGCLISTVITVNPVPASITGTAKVCVGLTTPLTDAVSGGIWTSSNTAKATVASDGTVTGVAAGNATITYTLPTGCLKTVVVTVNPLPASVGGLNTVCVGSAISLNDATVGGTWVSSDGTVASVSSTGVVTGVGIGSANITYALATGCTSTALITVNPLPSSISGTGTVCIGLTTSLTDVDAGGLWTSGTPGVATINFSSGLVTGIATGVSNITYAFVSTGCKVTTVVTVDALPAAITGPSSVCLGQSITISDATLGGTWSSSNTAIGSIGAGSGVVLGESAGTAVMTYTLPTGCIRTTTIVVNPLPAAISGALTVCVGYTTTLSDAVGGGTWSSSTTSAATIGISSGLVTGVSASGVSSGITTITYALSTGCNTTAVLTVNPVPSAIIGATRVCVGQTITLSDAASSGTWVSADPTVATVDPVGVVTGVAAGNTTISYILSTGCYKTVGITVNQLPAPITGATIVCVGLTTGLADATPGGAWSSNTTPVATVGVTGIVSGVSSGTATISYAISSTGCYNTTTIVVNPNPSTIAGAASVCSGATTTLSDATPGGTWSTSNTTVAVIDASGVVTGAIPGGVTITYLLPTGCKTTLPFAVNPLPGPITGTTYVCVGSTTVLHDVTVGGTWSSDSISVATVSGGSVLGVSAGTATISYIPPTGCVTSIVVTVNPSPGPINGTLAVCTGGVTALTDSVSGGEWTSGNTLVASAGTLTGIITGISAGSSTITYTLGTGCKTTSLLAVFQTPSAITGPDNVCEGSEIVLSDAITGGVWSSSDTTVATVGAATGHVVGALNIAGPVTISYTLGGMCSVSKVINVNQTPTPIEGVFVICSGYDTTLTDAIAGGTWASSNTAVATVGLSTGTVAAIRGGITNISYTLGTGCFATIPVTVNTTPSVISGPTNVCEGLTIALSDTVALGTWTSDEPSVATVSGGLVTGIASGVATISYVVGTGCGVATTINVNPAPPAILGSLVLCTGSTTALTDAAAADGIWISSNPAAGPVDLTSGVVSGISTDTVTITFELLATGCTSSVVVTIDPVPAAITGISNVCTGATMTLSDTTAFGTWSSSDGTTATVGSGTGIVTGVAAGFVTITYTAVSGCYTTALIRVNQSPDVITGLNMVCQGLVVNLSDATTFGTWTSSDTATAVVNPVTGDVTGMAAGTTTITFLLGTGCFATQQMTVNPLPAPIVGPPIVCVGSSVFLSDATSGGAWTSTNGSATIGSAGDVTGVSSGTDTLIYTITATGCLMTHFITVDPVPTPIVGSDIVCVGSVDTMTSTPAGGLWTSSNTVIATVGPVTGYVTGVSAGNAIITYTSLAGCNAIATITVNPVPNPITGINNLCPGLTTTLFDVTGGGQWSSTDALAASVDASGTVSAILAGTTATISYTLLSDGCAATLVFTVNPLPYVGSITGAKIFCMTSSSALSDSVAGGVWSTSNPSIATINASGVATGIAVGTATISYTVTEQCGMDTATTTIQINPLPYAGVILGFPQMCIYAYTALADSVAGGKWSSSDTAVAKVDSLTGVVYGASAGSASIMYTYTNFCGAATASIEVTVNATFAFAQIVTFPDSTLCSNTMFQNFGVLLPEPPGIAYHWSATNAEVYDTGWNGQYAIVSFPNPGPAVVKMSAEILSSGCVIADSFVTNISSSVSSNPGVQYYLDEFICTDNTQDSYQWGYDDIQTLDSTILDGQTTQDYYNPTPDTMHKNYWVMTTKNGCAQKSYYAFRFTTGITNVNENNFDIRLFPNPADSKVNIEVTGLNGNDEVQVKVIDMLGKEIQAATLFDGKGTIRVADLPSGVYSVIITRNNVKIGSKIFVKN